MSIQEDIAVSKFDVNSKQYRDDNNYMLLWMKKGFESVSIDFEHFSSQTNSVFFIVPGRNVRVKYNSAPEGWLLKFSRGFFKEHLSGNMAIKDVDIFSTFGEIPKIILSSKIGNRVHSIAEMIDELTASQIPNKEFAIASLLKTLFIYCDSKCNIRVTDDNNSSQIQIVSTFKDLVEQHYMSIHKVSDYASMMNITAKHLNQVIKNILGMTAKAYIQEQLTIQARRELKFSNDSIKEIAYKLGFSEPFYFSSYFKRQMGCSPSEYRLL